MDRFLHELWIARWALLDGFARTVEVSGAAIVIGSALGLLVGTSLAYGPRALRWICRFYADVIRGTPVLVLVLASCLPSGPVRQIGAFHERRISGSS